MLSISSEMLSISSQRRLEAPGGAPGGAQMLLEAPRRLLGGPQSDFWHTVAAKSMVLRGTRDPGPL